MGNNQPDPSTINLERTMLPSYNTISEEDAKIERGTPALLPTPQLINKRLTGVKIGLSIVFALATAALLGLAFLYYAFQYEVRERQSLQSSHVTLSERTAALETTSDEYKSELSRLNERLTNSVQKNSSIQNEIRQDIEKRRFEILNLQKRMKMIEDQDVFVSQDSPPPASSDNTPRQAFSTAAQGAVPTIQAQTLIGPELPTQPISNERVLTINRKFQFVVINVGSEDQVKEGDQFQTVRNGNVIGLVEIEKLYDSFSAATIIKENKDAPIEVGDAIQRLS